jgi:hypothetical protein
MGLIRMISWLCVSCWAVAAFAQAPKAPDGQPNAKPAEAAAVDHKELIRQLHGDDPRSVREAAETIQKAVPPTGDDLIALADAVKSALATTRDAKAEAALRLALGKLAAAGVEDAAEWGFESMSVTHKPTTPKEVFEAHVRALEMVPGAAKELMIGNLDVALNLPEADPIERQRIKHFVVLTAEAMRTKELSDFLDALLRGEEDLFVKVEAPLEVRLLAAYLNVQVKPPINADAVVEWIEKHPGGPAEVEIAALETISVVGTTKQESLTKLADRLLAKSENAAIIAKRLLAGQVGKSLLPQVAKALREHTAKTPSAELTRLLADLEKLKP